METLGEENWRQEKRTIIQQTRVDLRKKKEGKKQKASQQKNKKRKKTRNDRVSPHGFCGDSLVQLPHSYPVAKNKRPWEQIAAHVFRRQYLGYGAVLHDCGGEVPNRNLYTPGGKHSQPIRDGERKRKHRKKLLNVVKSARKTQGGGGLYPHWCRQDRRGTEREGGLES